MEHSVITDVKDVYLHVLAQLLTITLGLMEPDGNFKINISPRLESILVAVILNDLTGKNFVLKIIFMLKVTYIYICI
jgi:hypothetical protein